jgi:hypothetical protein
MAVTVQGLETEIRARNGSVTLAGAVTAKTLADVLGTSVRTLEDWRQRGIGPPSFTSNGQPTGRRFYLLVDVVHHINAALEK